MSTFQLPASIVSSESRVSSESLLSAASYDSPVKTHKPPNELEAPGAPKAPRALAKRKIPDEPNEDSSTCSRTLVFPQ